MAMSREQLHRIIDAQPDDKVNFIAKKLTELIVKIDVEPSSAEDVQAIREARAEFERGEPIRLDDLLKDLNDEDERRV